MRLLRLGTALVLVVALTGCRGDAPASTACGSGAVVGGRAIRIATTVAPLTSIVAAVTAGSGAEVTGIVPEGTNSHTYEPAPSVAAVLERADVVFLNGLGLEEPTRRLALANLTDGAEVCELGTTVLPVDEYLFDVAFPESAGRPNPHLWTDPPMAARYAELVRDVLVDRDPANADVYVANAARFTDGVDALDAALRDATSTIDPADRLLLTYHDAYAYFAADYGWTVLGALQPSSFDEPSPREIARLIEQIRATHVRAVFGSEVFPSPVLQQIAAETGVEYVDDLRDDDLPGRPGDADHSWFALMRFNYVTLIGATGGDVSPLERFEAPEFEDSATYPQ